ncbi:endonuclease Q family protein [Alkalibacillus silvisoli]|uniref:TIGR00375 family protein n=1 Tax=Alkalibacillus silvisoli TaxID=392823 RepID=A0ABP3JMF7_9BACI
MSKQYYADLHIHIGQTYLGNPVKISASNNLTVPNIIHFAKNVKGIDLVGIIDAHVPEVLKEIEKLIKDQSLYELDQGGVTDGNVTVLLGSEVEIYDANCSGPIHVLCYFPTIERMKQFATWYQQYVKNPHLSSQRLYVTGSALQQKVRSLKGMFIPAHIFTPFKSLYGKGVKSSLTEVFDADLIDGIELGLSSDTSMAEVIRELKPYTFLTNSDAHSLENIGREYQVLTLKNLSFEGVRLALKGGEHHYIKSNFGMNPKLGKYFESKCRNCNQHVSQVDLCEHCGSKRIVKGVSKRIEEISQTHGPTTPVDRPPYIHQVPLTYVPGIGHKTLEQLREKLHHDMYIIHHATIEELTEVANESIAQQILNLRKGLRQVVPGGGGKYGKIK